MKNKYIKISLTKDNNIYLSNNDYDKLNLKLNINSNITLSPCEYFDDAIYFDLSDYSGLEISNLSFSMNTFNPEKEGLGPDTRDLGIPIKQIIFTDLLEDKN